MLKKISRRLAGFITDHITWEFLVWLLAKTWISGFASALAGAVAIVGWTRKQPLYITAPAALVFVVAVFTFSISASLRKKGISEIRFDYVPERSPEQEDWELVLDQGTLRPTFSLAGDPPDSDKCLYVAGIGYRLDYRTKLHESLCGTVEYSARLKDSDSSVVYAQVRMTSKDGGTDKDGWLAHKFDTTPGAKKLDPGEWTLKDPGKMLSGTGWRSFRWSLPQEVERTFGTDNGWVYKRLLRIRLRGTLSITPIRLLEK